MATATIRDFLAWLHGDLGTRKSIGDHAEYVSAQGQGPGPIEHGPGFEELVIRLYTATNRYTIRARAAIECDTPGKAIRYDPAKPLPKETLKYSGRLGCTASARLARAGEHWHRGSDLPDGPLCEETWRRILAAIVQRELVQVHHRTLATSGVIGSALWTGPYRDGAPAPVSERIGEDYPVSPEGDDMRPRDGMIAGGPLGSDIAQSNLEPGVNIGVARPFGR